MDTLIAGVVGALITVIGGLIGKKMDWFSPKSKIEVAKIESEIRTDDSENQARKTQDEVSISRIALEITIQLKAQLEKAELVINSLKEEKDSLHKAASALRKESIRRDLEHSEQDRQNKETIMDLQNKLEVSEGHLELSRIHCAEIKTQLEKITGLYNELKTKHGYGS